MGTTDKPPDTIGLPHAACSMRIMCWQNRASSQPGITGIKLRSHTKTRNHEEIRKWKQKEEHHDPRRHRYRRPVCVLRSFQRRDSRDANVLSDSRLGISHGIRNLPSSRPDGISCGNTHYLRPREISPYCVFLCRIANVVCSLSHRSTHPSSCISYSKESLLKVPIKVAPFWSAAIPLPLFDIGVMSRPGGSRLGENVVTFESTSIMQSERREPGNGLTGLYSLCTLYYI